MEVPFLGRVCLIEGTLSRSQLEERRESERVDEGEELRELGKSEKKRTLELHLEQESS